MNQNDSEFFHLTSKEQQFLSHLTVSDELPGSIVRDFNTVLGMVGERGMETGGKYGFFPMGRLAEINAKLTHSIQLTSQRPQQKSFPHIHGLYLLLRATGIAILRKKKKKMYLFLDEAVFNSWNSLNTTEQYFTLLEAWLIQGNEEIILEYNRGFPDHLSKCLLFLRRFEKGKTYKSNQQKDEFRYTPKLYNLALLQMFGFITIQSVSKKVDKFWMIDQVKLTDLGRIMIPLLHHATHEEEGIIEKVLCGEEKLQFGEWQSHFQSFFPDWKNNLIIAETEFQEGIYVFKVSLGKVWRRISISADQVLDLLSNAILGAFDFDHDHLYQFTYKNRKGLTIRVNAPELEEPPYTTEILVGDLGLSPGDTFDYLFDFGDQWEFEVKLEKIEPNNPEIAAYVLLESYGEAPEQYEYDDFDEYE